MALLFSPLPDWRVLHWRLSGSLGCGIVITGKLDRGAAGLFGFFLARDHDVYQARGAA
jgi:hypothetical protein